MISGIEPPWVDKTASENQKRTLECPRASSCEMFLVREPYGTFSYNGRHIKINLDICGQILYIHIQAKYPLGRVLWFPAMVFTCFAVAALKE